MSADPEWDSLVERAKAPDDPYVKLAEELATFRAGMGTLRARFRAAIRRRLSELGAERRHPSSG